MPLEKISDFRPSLVATVVSEARLSHPVSRGELASDPFRSWIKKDSESAEDARFEQLAQEFLRLVIPYQPETRLAVDDSRRHYILSEEIRAYRQLPVGHAGDFETGRFQGLGAVSIAAAFIQEIDFKNGNVGLDSSGRVIKIDGDWSLIALRHQWENKIAGRPAPSDELWGLTPKVIERMPYIYQSDYSTFNWLDVVREKTMYPASAIVRPQLSVVPSFRAEINQTMLKMCLLPDVLIDEFVRSYAPPIAEKVKQFFKERRDELMQSALMNPSFREYLRSEAAAEQITDFVEYLRTFESNREPLLSPDAYAEVQRVVALRQERLGCRALMTDITLLAQERRDVALERAMQKLGEDITRNKGDIPWLSRTKAQLTEHYTALRSRPAPILPVFGAPAPHPDDFFKSILNPVLKRAPSGVAAEFPTLAGAGGPAQAGAGGPPLAGAGRPPLAGARKPPLAPVRTVTVPEALSTQGIRVSREPPLRTVGEQAPVLRENWRRSEVVSMIAESVRTKTPDELNSFLIAKAMELQRQLTRTVPLHDDVLRARMRQCATDFLGIRSFPNEKLRARLLDLAQTWEWVHSAEVMDVMTMAKQWREKGQDKRATALEKALYTLPLEHRQHVISGPINPVQELLAAKKNWIFGSSVAPKTGDNRIDLTKADPAFKELRDKWTKVRRDGEDDDGVVHVTNPLAGG